MTTNTYKGHDFLDIFADVFTYPEDLEMYNVKYRHTARHEDARRIRRDIDKAIEDIGLLEHQAV